jgi:hypothetical protein
MQSQINQISDYKTYTHELIGFKDKPQINDKKANTQNEVIVKPPASIELNTKQHKKNKLQDILNKLWTPEQSLVKVSTRLQFKTPFVSKKGRKINKRRSANGKGKQISKNGAGSKTTWGNIEQLAKIETVDYLNKEEEG